MKKFLIFLGGVAIGGGGGFLVTNALLKQKYEQISEEEIASVKESFRNELEKRQAVNAEEAAKAFDKYTGTDMDGDQEVGKLVNQIGHEAKKTEYENGQGKPLPAPYVITQLVYDDPTKPFKSLSWRYYSDGAVIKDDNQPVQSMEELDRTIGRECLANFDDEDVLYVRNEQMGVDIEITMVGRTWAEELKEKPHPRA